MMTLRARLTLVYLALLALCLTGFGTAAYTYVDTQLHREFESSLRARADQLVPLLLSASEGPPGIRPQLERVSLPADTFVMVETDAPEQAIQYKTDSLVDRALPDIPTGQVVPVRTDLGPLSLYAVPFEVESRQGAPAFSGQVTVARSTADIDASLRLLRTILIVGGIAVLGFAALLGLGASTALLRPLDRMRARAQQIGGKRDFHLRMPVERPHDELGRLSTSVNQMLSELERAHGGLQAALDAQRRFVADASHELRTPVTAIRANLEFVERTPDARPEDRDEALRDAATEIRRLEELIGDLLALARLEAGGAPVHRPLRVDQVVTEVHLDLCRLAPEDMEVLAETPDEVWVRGDRGDLRRAVWNLAENAVKYRRPGGGGQVRLSLTTEGADVLVRVTDDGLGIAADDQAYVFDRFWRGNASRSKNGSGLGLAITRWVAQTHQGSVTVTSGHGQGSTFTLRLPQAGAPDSPEPSPVGATEVVSARSERGG